ncbi:hypothetical protein [Marinicrinis sediminis]|uniref:Intracellular septation protein A n=1 Tax=Marinicrinis sediminis TaxID=1652465 RepID=A0ABW5RAX8_9BACL
MRYFEFQFFSMLESLALFYFFFMLFRLPYLRTFPQVIFMSFILCQTSYYLREQFGMPSGVVTVAYEVLIIMFYYFMYRIKLLYSILLSILTVLFTLATQLLVFIILVEFGIFTAEETVPFSFATYMNQLVSVFLFILLGWGIAKFRFYVWLPAMFKTQSKEIHFHYRTLFLACLIILINWLSYFLLMKSTALAIVVAIVFIAEIIVFFWVFVRKELHHGHKESSV